VEEDEPQNPSFATRLLGRHGGHDDAHRTRGHDVVDTDDASHADARSREHRAERVLVIDQRRVWRNARGHTLRDEVIDLVVGGEGGAAVEVGIPEGDDTSP